MGLLDRQAPRVDETIVEMLALIAKRTGLGPRLDHHFMCFVEVLAIEGGVGIGGELFATATAYPPSDQPAAGDHVDHAELFGEAQRIAYYRQRVAQENDFYLLGDTCQNCSFDVHHRAHAKGGVVMLVQHHAVEAELFGEDLLVEILIEQLSALDRIEMFVFDTEETGLDDFVIGNIPVWTFSEVHQMHRDPSFRALS